MLDLATCSVFLIQKVNLKLCLFLVCVLYPLSQLEILLLVVLVFCAEFLNVGKQFFPI